MRYAKLAIGALVALLVASDAASAQSNYPAKPVRIVVPTGPGGATDVTARSVAEFLTRALGETFVVENKPGAQGRVAATYFVQQPSDGYTLFMMASSQSVLPALYELPYDTLKDFTPIAVLSTAPTMLLVNKKLSVTSIDELIAYAKKHPSEITFGYQGGPPQLAGAGFGKMVGINAVGVPFNASAQALTELVAGRLTYIITTADVAKAQVEGGTLVALAAVGKKRAELFPDIPSLYELNYKLEGSGWFGLTGPRDLPPAITEKIFATLKEGYIGKAPQSALARSGLEPVGEGPAQFKARLSEAIERWQDVAAGLGIKRTKL
ncbi:MAG: tripartite tricarboxylate transporter substrate binding protein [Hyphomicrobiales bacterium]|nr:tripartite tricarboxylate transporter substrate binding protein [Alphaproteobacteria bacterium]